MRVFTFKFQDETSGIAVASQLSSHCNSISRLRLRLAVGGPRPHLQFAQDGNDMFAIASPQVRQTLCMPANLHDALQY